MGFPEAWCDLHRWLVGVDNVLAQQRFMQCIQQRLVLPPLCQTHCASAVQAITRSVQKIFTQQIILLAP
ncbi:hypothetical protein BOO94_02555 [Pseudomonas sp. FSL W5-0299]|nr:hypothetical protein BOO94_02555 [Pseudomonas sp. FSL W5-0299]